MDPEPREANAHRKGPQGFTVTQKLLGLTLVRRRGTVAWGAVAGPSGLLHGGLASLTSWRPPRTEKVFRAPAAPWLRQPEVRESDQERKCRIYQRQELRSEGRGKVQSSGCPRPLGGGNPNREHLPWRH